MKKEDQYQHLIGKTEEEVKDILSKEEDLSVRIKKPGMMYTQDWIPDRLNVHIVDGKATEVSFG